MFCLVVMVCWGYSLVVACFSLVFVGIGWLLVLVVVSWLVGGGLGLVLFGFVCVGSCIGLGFG